VRREERRGEERRGEKRREEVLPEDGDRIQSPKCLVFYIKTGRWIMFRNIIFVLMYHHY
jgi:hypothetical protein